MPAFSQRLQIKPSNWSGAERLTAERTTLTPGGNRVFWLPRPGAKTQSRYPPGGENATDIKTD